MENLVKCIHKYEAKAGDIFSSENIAEMMKSSITTYVVALNNEWDLGEEDVSSMFEENGWERAIEIEEIFDSDEFDAKDLGDFLAFEKIDEYNVPLRAIVDSKYTAVMFYM